MEESLFDSKFFLPSWWINAFEKIVLMPQGVQDPFGIVNRTGLYPSYNTAEMMGISAALSVFQRQLVRKSVCRICVSDHAKYNPSGNRNFAFGFSRVLQLLSCLRVLHKSNGKLAPMIEIIKDRWVENKDGHSFDLEYELTPPGKALILGYSDGYYNLICKNELGVDLAEILGMYGPLVVSHSVWMDLIGIEQLLFIRAEKAAQWRNDLLSLDGVYGLDFKEIFAGLDNLLPSGQLGNPLLRKVSALERLGKKLVDHGLIEKATKYGYLALDGGNEPKVLWKLSSLQLGELSGEKYRQEVANLFVDTLFASNWERIYTMFMCEGFTKESTDDYAVRKSDEMKANVKRFVTECLERESKSFSKLATVHGSTLLSLGPLFIEWSLRQMPGHRLPLPESISLSEPAMIATQLPLSLHGFESFSKAMLARTDIIEGLFQIPRFTLASPITQKLPLYLTKGESKGSDVILTNQNQVKMSPGELNTDDRISLKKRAADELLRLRSDNSSDYMSLKKHYIESLDEKSRKIIVEVQRRLTPKVFEEHIRHSLIRFMVEHPEVWH